MWHASIGGSGLSARVRRRLALKALAGVGDLAHQWEQDRSAAYHVRRRLTAEEATRTGPVVDLRSTPEGRARYEKMLPELPLAVWPMATQEVSEAHG